MPVKADAVCHAKCGRLANIVQQYAHGERRRCVAELLQHQQGMRPHIALGMILRRLFDALHGRHFGQDIRQHPGGVQQLEAVARSTLRENAHQFIAHALGRHFQNQFVIPADGRESYRLDLKLQPRSKANGAQQAQVVFAEPGFRIADGADHAAFQVGAPADEVQHLARIRVEQQSVDGEVAALRVLGGVGFKVHRVGTAPVAILLVAAESGDLDLGEHVTYQDYAEVRPHAAGLRKQIHDAVGPGIGRDVVIFRRHA